MFAATVRNRRSRARRGSTIPMVAIMTTVMAGMVAFAIDIGSVAVARTELQATADAGDLAGLGNLYSSASATQNFASARAEVRKYVGGPAGNFPGLVVNDPDIQFGYFDSTAAVGSRFTTNLKGRKANAMRVVLRRDGTTNSRLPLAFGPILGKTENNVQAQATAWMPPAQGVLAGSEVIPYVAHVDYFNAAAGYPARPSSADGFQSVSPGDFTDKWVVGSPGTLPTAGSDGVKELLLFDSGGKKTPGNWGSIDLGSASNGTPELIRQLLNGPNASDFSILQKANRLASDGSLQAPVSLGGDTGISNGTKSAWDAIIGKNKIIPLYDTVSGPGNNAVYHVVGFAGVRIVAVDLQGNPKRVWVQPTDFYSNKVTAAPPGSAGMVGVYAPPRLVIP